MPGLLGCKLGSNPFAHGALDLDKYVADTSIVVPTSLSRPQDTKGYSYGLLDNGTYGDCVAAAAYHIQETFKLRRGIVPAPWLASTCLAWYFAVNGVPPGPPGSSSDQGTDPSAAMAYWQKVGLPGHQLAGWGVLQPGSPNIKRAIWEFGAVMWALAMPISAQNQNVTWTFVSDTGDGAPASWGGHAICGDSFSASEQGFISWGMEGTMDNAFVNAYTEEVMVPLSHDALNAGGIGPAGFNFAAMQKDLQGLTTVG